MTVEPQPAGSVSEQEPVRPPARPPAQITLLYESRDGKLCVFEDAAGHLTAVRASKLA